MVSAYYLAQRASLTFIYSRHFLLRVRNISGKCMCARFIHFASFNDFAIEFWTVWYFFILLYYLAHIHFPEMLRTLNKKWREYINVREYRRGNQKWTIQRNWQHRVHNTKKNTTQYVYVNVLFPLPLNRLLPDLTVYVNKTTGVL
jgi:hypothetical protein